MLYVKPEITDYGSIVASTFSNDGTGVTVPGVGPKGKNPMPLQGLDKFNEPSHS